MTRHISDDELIEELKLRIDQSRKAFSDLTVVNRKLIELNRKLEESETLKTNFLSNIRNEINNPLNSIIGLSQQIVGISSTKDASELARMVYSEAINLEFQLRNIFVAAELEAGETAPVPSKLDITSIVDNVIISFRAAAVQKSVSLNTIFTDTSPEKQILFCTDAEKLQVILSNLISNAIEFNKDGGEVFTTITLDGDLLQISVRDTGLGIEDANLPRIFDRFTQLDTGSMRSHRGHGLGLSVVRSLVELMGGTISVESRIGEGSIFTVNIPALEPDDGEMAFAEGGNLFLFDSMDET